MKHPATYFFLVTALIVQLALPCHLPAEERDAKAPDFSLTDLNGKVHRLSDYRGKIVMINFWASWCQECILEMPSLNALYETHRKDDLVVLGVAADRKKETVLEMLKKTPVSYPLLLDTTGGIFIKQYTVIGLPTTVVLDRNGRIAERIIGRTDFGSASFAKKLQDLFGQGGTK